MLSSFCNDEQNCNKRYGQEVVYNDVFDALLAERRRTGSKSQRAQISKSIRKHLRRALREQRNGRIKHVLDEFKDLDRLTHHARAPVYPCPPRKDENCPGPDEFANFLENIFASEMGFESPSLKSLVRETNTTGFRGIERFTMVELQDALKHLRRNKCADSNGIVAECFVHGNLELHEHLLRIFNSMLVDGYVGERWKQTTFSMIPNTGDPTNPATISFRFVSKPRVSDTWAWHTGALLALCETKGLRQDFPLLQVGKQSLIKVSTPDHSGCKFVRLGPPGILRASSALRLFSNPGPKGLTRKHALPPHISGRQGCNLSRKH